jgi:uncharacterized protein DUF5320
MIRRQLGGMGCGFGGRGFAAGRGFGMGRGMGLGPNLSNYCRFDPSQPSRRAMFWNAQYNQNDAPNDVEILKSQAEYLKSELEAINNQLNKLNQD